MLLCSLRSVINHEAKKHLERAGLRAWDIVAVTDCACVKGAGLA